MPTAPSLALAALLGLVMLAPPALAADAAPGNHESWGTDGKPYVIVKDCDGQHRHCKVRLDHAPLQHPMVVRPGSYWYQTPFENGEHGDFRPRS